MTEVLVPVEQQDRALAEDRPQQRIRLTGVKAHLAVPALEHLADELGLEHHHEAAVEERRKRDRVAVNAPAER